MKLAKGTADPLRITGGTGDAADDLQASLLFSANYRALKVDKFSVAFSAAGLETEFPIPDSGYPHLTFALAILADGSPLYPYFYEFRSGPTTLRAYVLWQVTATVIRCWVSGTGQDGTLHIWNVYS